MYENIVIGGGISGVFIASKIGSNTLLVERTSVLGGRIKTGYEDNKVIYEKGPWRISEAHSRTLRLLKSLKQGIAVLPSSTKSSTHINLVELQKQSRTKNCCPGSSLSVWGANSIDKSPSYADKIDKSTGYSNFHEMAVGSNTYEAEDTIDTHQYFVAKNGLTKLIDAMRNKIKGDVKLSSNVDDISYLNGYYSLQITQRNMDENNTFFTYNVKCKNIFCCVPPYAMKEWSIAKVHLKPIIPLVSSLPLMHIYGKVDYSNTILNPLKGFHIITPGLTSQIISPMYSACYPREDINNLYSMVGYAGGREADTLQNLLICNHNKFIDIVKSDFFKTLDSINALPNYTCPDIRDISSYYWKNAVHAWNPLWNLDVEKVSKSVITPHVTKLPNFYIAGEAFSTIQGWIEGALQTSEWVLNKYYSRKSTVMRPFGKFPERYVIYDDRVIDLKSWMDRHPGGVGALENHLGQDVVSLMESINHPSYTYGILYCLQVGYKIQNKMVLHN